MSRYLSFNSKGEKSVCQLCFKKTIRALGSSVPPRFCQKSPCATLYREKMSVFGYCRIRHNITHDSRISLLFFSCPLCLLSFPTNSHSAGRGCNTPRRCVAVGGGVGRERARMCPNEGTSVQTFLLSELDHPVSPSPSASLWHRSFLTRLNLPSSSSFTTTPPPPLLLLLLLRSTNVYITHPPPPLLHAAMCGR